MWGILMVVVVVVAVMGLAFCKWTLTTSNGVTHSAVMVDPTEPEIILALSGTLGGDGGCCC